MTPNELGLVPADPGVIGQAFQIKGERGQALAGARITVGGQQLVADARGVIKLPEATPGEALIATVSAPGYVPGRYELVPGFALPLVPIDGKRTRVSAAAGAALSNTDGTMQVTFSPGALSGDAEVAVTRLYHEAFATGQLLPAYMPVHFVEGVMEDVEAGFDGPATALRPQAGAPLGTYEYHLDLGGAQLQPGALVQVRFKAEPKLAKAIEENPAFFESEGAVQDASGQWWFTMVVPTEPTGADRSILKAKASSGGAKKADPPKSDPKPAKQEAPKKPEPPPQPEKSKVDGKLVLEFDSKADAMAWMKANDLKSNNTAGNKTDNLLDAKLGGDVTGMMVHDKDLNKGHCTYITYPTDDPPKPSPQPTKQPTAQPTKQPTAQPTVQPTAQPTAQPTKQPPFSQPTSQPPIVTELWRTGNVRARVTWESDDERIAGRAAVAALVTFSHSGTPLRLPTSMAYVQPDGYALAYGGENMPGIATASMSDEPGIFGTSAKYAVNYGVFDLKLVKRRPQVTLKVTAHGDPVSGTLQVPTSMGELALSSTASPTVRPQLGLSEFNRPFAIAGSALTGDATRIDASSESITVNWNGNYLLPTQLSFSKRIGARGAYEVDDAEGPADQRPQNVWSSKLAGAVATFEHPTAVTTGRNPDVLRFEGVEAASTWGLNGKPGYVKFDRSLNGVTLTGASRYTVGQASEVAVGLNARLPKVRFTVATPVSEDMVMTYELVRADGVKVRKTMSLGRPQGTTEVKIPIEEPQGQPFIHTFRVVGIAGSSTSMSVRGQAEFPELKLRRGGPVQSYATLVANFDQAKFRQR